jgi:hypothetical protein
LAGDSASLSSLVTFCFPNDVFKNGDCPLYVDGCYIFHAALKDQMLEKETELASAKKELAELEQYQVGYCSTCIN